MNAKEAIKQLQIISSGLEKEANRHEIYNTDLAYYLEIMSFEMHKYANELIELEYHFGVTHSINMENAS